MSARELKTQLHEKIEALTDTQTVQVYEFVRSQLEQAEETFFATPEMLEQLRADLTVAQQTNYVGITTGELQHKMKKWLTR